MTTAEITLNTDQQAALDRIYQFLCDPNEPVFVLSGYSGCGKSTLMRALIDRLPDFYRTIKLLHPQFEGWPLELTATTNKAAENLQQITGSTASTIYSCLGLLVRTDYQTGKTEITPKKNAGVEGLLLVVDEASYVDSMLLEYIFKLTKRCKILFVGDPAQLLNVGTTKPPVFNAGFPEASLTTVVRQAEGNPILTLATQFRHTVNTGEWQSFKPDDVHVCHLAPEDFQKAIEQEFSRPDWRYSDSKILAWTNKRVIQFNQFVRNHAKGDPHFEEGDYAVVNSFLIAGKGLSYKTDQLVHITDIGEDVEQHGVTGKFYTLNGTGRAFMPNSLEDKLAAIKKAKANDDMPLAIEMEQNWVDLRAVYAQTINKSQGSTYDKVFIDLNDVARCHNGDQLARMLYVGVSRARYHVYLTGDLA